MKFYLFTFKFISVLRSCTVAIHHFLFHEGTTHVKSLHHPSPWGKSKNCHIKRDRWLLTYTIQVMGTKKIHKWLNVPLTTVRAIIKKFQTFGTVANLPGRGRKYMLSPRTVRNMVREAKKNPRTTVQELQAFVVSCGHKVSKSNIRPTYQQALRKGGWSWKVLHGGKIQDPSKCHYHCQGRLHQVLKTGVPIIVKPFFWRNS